MGGLWLKNAEGKRLADRHDAFPAHKDEVRPCSQWPWKNTALRGLTGVGHRLVHGGPDHVRHEKVTPELMNTLRSLISLAPLHLPGELKGIDAIAQHYPGVSQTAMFRHRFPQQDAGDRKVAGHCSEPPA